MCKSRVSVTSKAKDLVRQLADEFGPLMFYQAGGCCEGTQPMCFKIGGYLPRSLDVLIGYIEGFPFWIDHSLYEYWQNAHFEFDIIDGIGTGGFSLEIPKGKTFKINYTLLNEQDLAELILPITYKEWKQQQQQQ
jgi:uncharacterized protein (DUF779 family)